MNILRAELKAIRQFQPSPEMRTQTERDAVLIRKLRIAELVTKIPLPLHKLTNCDVENLLLDRMTRLILSLQVGIRLV